MDSKKNTVGEKAASPLLTIPAVPSEIVQYRIPKRIEVYEYFAIATGNCRIFKEEDGVKELGNQVILDPCKVSFFNLFINAVLQPKESYIVRKGEFELLTLDVPIHGSSVILQMIKV
ncbi:DUF4183 domain-containing protein [Metabacillus fastidiosus]|uniref:DUF4183 domain-containing protein n=1 Tax=Metabacillus fastidiosus TaxID=1458 RepID=UPI002E1B3FBA|nr:DUF4183 domain-containing protein [Metabacillus fastidiosus]